MKKKHIVGVSLGLLVILLGWFSYVWFQQSDNSDIDITINSQEPFEYSPVDPGVGSGYMYEDDDINLYLSFNPSEESVASAEDLREVFDFVNITYYTSPCRIAPPREKAECEYIQSREPIEELGEFVEDFAREGEKANQFYFSLDSFENSKLSGQIKIIGWKLTRHTTGSSDPDCRMGDIVGMCSESIRLTEPREVNIDFTIPFMWQAN